MVKYITRVDFRLLAPKKEYKSEGDFESEVKVKLAEFFKVKQSQVQDQFVTTGFEGNQSNRADFVIMSDEEIPHALIVIELKLDRHVKKYHNGSYTDAAKQLSKYCQDIRSPYGILLTDNYCLMYEFNYYLGHPRSKIADKIPSPKDIEERLTQRSILELATHKHSLKYIYYFLAILAILFLIGKGMGLIFLKLLKGN